MSTYFKSPANDRRHPLFSFQGLEIYTARHEDFWLALLWNEMDPHHAGKIDPSFWIEQSPGIEAYLMADKKGRLFFFKLVRTILAIGQESKTISAVRVFIQFPPQPGAVPPANVPINTEGRREAVQPVDHDRIMRALIQGREWIERCVALQGLSALCFESESPALIRFSKRHLGFRQDGGTLIKWIAYPKGMPPPAEKPMEGALESPETIGTK